MKKLGGPRVNPLSLVRALKTGPEKCKTSKKVAIVLTGAITNFDLRIASGRINLQVLEHLKHSPGNQSW
jgi:hypothetical protein